MKGKFYNIICGTFSFYVQTIVLTNAFSTKLTVLRIIRICALYRNETFGFQRFLWCSWEHKEMSIIKLRTAIFCKNPGF